MPAPPAASTPSRHSRPPPARGPSPGRPPPPPPPQSDLTPQRHLPPVPRVPHTPADPAALPSASHGAGSPPPPPHPPTRLRRDANPPPQQGKRQAHLAAPGLSRSRVRALSAGPFNKESPLRLPPDGARRALRARGLQGALRASAPAECRGPPPGVCAQRWDGSVVLPPPHLGIPFWDKRRCNLFTVLFVFSSPREPSSRK